MEDVTVDKQWSFERSSNKMPKVGRVFGHWLQYFSELAIKGLSFVYLTVEEKDMGCTFTFTVSYQYMLSIRTYGS